MAMKLKRALRALLKDAAPSQENPDEKKSVIGPDVPMELIVALGYAWELTCASMEIVIHPSTPVGVKAESAVLQLTYFQDKPFTKFLDQQLNSIVLKADTDSQAFEALTSAAGKLLGE